VGLHFPWKKIEKTFGPRLRVLLEPQTEEDSMQFIHWVRTKMVQIFLVVQLMEMELVVLQTLHHVMLLLLGVG
jgi:hypothetical protein